MTWRDALSALADGEEAGVDPRLVEAHVARCPECRAYRDEIARARRTYAMGPADRMVDLSQRVLALDRRADRAGRGVTRLLLALTATAIALQAVPDLLGHDGHVDAHGARHLGAFSAAYAAGLFFVVWRPARARTLLPVGAVLAAALVLTAVVDVAQRRVPLGGELTHLPEVASVALVWSLTTSPGQGHGRGSKPSARRGRSAAQSSRWTP